MWIPATQLRVGMLINHGGELYRIMSVMHITPGNKRGMMQTKMRSVRTGLQTENRFRSEDKIEKVTLDQREMEFLYESGDEYWFMNTTTHDQICLNAEALGDTVRFLIPNLRVEVEFDSEETPMGVSLPKTVDLTVTETAPGIKNATVTNALKPATTESGLVVQVPNFIDVGDVIRVETETGEYLSRAK